MYEKTSIGYCEAITPQNGMTDESVAYTTLCHSIAMQKLNITDLKLDKSNYTRICTVRSTARNYSI